MSGMMTMLAGANGLAGTATAPAARPTDTQVGVPASAVFSMLSDGTYTSTGEAGGNYCNPTSIAPLLDARLTVNSGTAPTGAATGIWLNLGTTRTWTLSVTAGGGIRATNCTLEIRDASTLGVLSTSTIDFEVQSI